MKSKTKEIALQTLVFAMEEIKINLEKTMLNEDVTAQSAAMKTLAEAYAIIAGSEGRR